MSNGQKMFRIVLPTIVTFFILVFALSSYGTHVSCANEPVLLSTVFAQEGDGGGENTNLRATAGGE